MTQIARLALGVALVALQVVWLFLRNQPPLSQWAPSTSAPGLLAWAAALACLLAGIRLIASALAQRTDRRHPHASRAFRAAPAGD